MKWNVLSPSAGLFAALSVCWSATCGVALGDDAAAIPPGESISTSISPLAQQLVSLAQAGVSEDVQIAFVKNHRQYFNVKTDDIIYLRDIGVTSKVLDAVMEHDNALAAAGVINPSATYTYQQKLYQPTNIAPVPSSIPNQAPTVPPNPETPQTAPQPQTQDNPTSPPTTQVLPPSGNFPDASDEASYYYTSLQSYGTWINLTGYGWCWQPSVIMLDRAWRPYCDHGHWVYSDAGWCWQSDYSWGWAPFHYGRWRQDPGLGWVWFPDRTWGPGWVCWRHSVDRCGWAPLPLHADYVEGIGFRHNNLAVGINYDFGLGFDAFTFIALNDFGERDYRHHRLNESESRHSFHNTVVINNFGFDREHGIVNRGVDRQRVESLSHQKIQVAEIRDQHAAPTSHSSPGAPVIIRHDFSRPAPITPLPATHVQPLNPNHPPAIRGPGIPQSPGSPSTPRGNDPSNNKKHTEYVPSRSNEVAPEIASRNHNKEIPRTPSNNSSVPAGIAFRAGPPLPAGLTPPQPQAIPQPAPILNNGVSSTRTSVPKLYQHPWPTPVPTSQPNNSGAGANQNIKKPAGNN